MGSKLRDMHSLFQQNKFATAFYGDPTFFMKDELWGDHNSTLVFMHYIDWAVQQTNYSSEFLKSFFSTELEQNRLLNQISNELAPIALLRFYCQAADIKKTWPVSQTEIVKILFNIKEIFSEKEIEEYRVVKDLNLFLKYLPEVAQVIQTLQKEG